MIRQKPEALHLLEKRLAGFNALQICEQRVGHELAAFRQMIVLVAFRLRPAVCAVNDGGFRIRGGRCWALRPQAARSMRAAAISVLRGGGHCVIIRLQTGIRARLRAGVEIDWTMVATAFRKSSIMNGLSSKWTRGWETHCPLAPWVEN